MKKSKTILLVEDDKDDQESFIQVISEIENATLLHIANNGVEALEVLERSETLPALIFMDINMPKMNGLECLSEIIKNPQTKNIPVVMLTTSIHDAEQVRQLGAKAFIKKGSDKILMTQIKGILNIDLLSENNSEQVFQIGF